MRAERSEGRETRVGRGGAASFLSYAASEQESTCACRAFRSAGNPHFLAAAPLSPWPIALRASSAGIILVRLSACGPAARLAGWGERDRERERGRKTVRTTIRQECYAYSCSIIDGERRQLQEPPTHVVVVARRRRREVQDDGGERRFLLHRPI